MSEREERNERDSMSRQATERDKPERDKPERDKPERDKPERDKPERDKPDRATAMAVESERLGVRYVAFLGLASFGCAADLLTKAWIFSWPRGPGEQGEWWLIEPYVGIQHALNQGALWGMGQGKVAMFATLSILAALGILYWVFRGGAARDWWLTLTLGAVLGGILGNLYDRLGLWGGRELDGSTIYAVRDWILFRYGQWVWPNFNIADCLLVVGACLLAWHSLRAPTGHPNEERRSESV